MKKVAIIGTAGVPARYGGFETLVHHLVKNWKGLYDITVYCSNKFYDKDERKSEWEGAKLVHLPLNANGIQSIIYDIVSIIHAVFYADVLLILGVSGGVILPFVKLFTNKKIIVNIDGLEWRRPKWSKPVQLFLKWSEWLAVKYSDIDITDNYALKRYTAINYGTLSYLVAYGADHVRPSLPNDQHKIDYSFLKREYAFKVCRIEPENNVHVILESFSKVKLPLVLVGNWNNSEYGQELKATYSKYNNLYLLDPIYDQGTLDVLRSNATLYVHGHSAGGTNPSLVEAMYLGLPVVAFDVVYNRATMKDKGAYFKSEEDLISFVNNLDMKQLQHLAEEMGTIAQEFYTWATIAKRYHAIIRGLYIRYSKKQVQAQLGKLSHDQLKSMSLVHLKYAKKFYQEKQ